MTHEIHKRKHIIVEQFPVTKCLFFGTYIRRRMFLVCWSCADWSSARMLLQRLPKTTSFHPLMCRPIISARIEMLLQRSGKIEERLKKRLENNIIEGKHLGQKPHEGDKLKLSARIEMWHPMSPKRPNTTAYIQIWKLPNVSWTWPTFKRCGVFW